MALLDVLGQPVEVTVAGRRLGSRAEGMVAALGEMAAAINAGTVGLGDRAVAVFQLTERVTLFLETRFKGRRMRRSFMAQAERTFFWQADEFTRLGDGMAADTAARRRLSYYFHDCWHVRQFVEDGPAPNDDEILIDREQEAMAEQLAIARHYRCDANLIAFLEGFANDRERIAERLREGIGLSARIRPHLPIL
jgi:hypothetical protein